MPLCWSTWNTVLLDQRKSTVRSWDSWPVDKWKTSSSECGLQWVPTRRKGYWFKLIVSFLPAKIDWYLAVQGHIEVWWRRRHIPSSHLCAELRRMWGHLWQGSVRQTTKLPESENTSLSILVFHPHQAYNYFLCCYLKNYICDRRFQTQGLIVLYADWLSIF